MSVHDFTVRTMDGKEQSLADYRGFVLLIVNTASQCGFTPQYRELQELYEQYRDRGLMILGFPCNQFANQEPGSDEEIRQFCQVNYGVTFPLFAKTKVKGPDAHPLFQYLTREAPGIGWKGVKWNFTKFLVDSQGQVLKRFAPSTKPSSIIKEIEPYLPIQA